jgi:hypothetical protein
MNDVVRKSSIRKHDTHAGRRRRTQIDGQFAARLIEMLRSPAWCVLSLSARRILDRVEIELADHGGVDNGKLPVTFNDFVRYGIHRHSIGPAIRECVALGFLEVTETGRAGNADWRKPNLFRLTYKHTDYAGPTHEWKKIIAEDAEAIALIARKATSERQNSSAGFCQTPVRETGTENPNSKVQKPSLQAKVQKPSLLSISRVGTRKPDEDATASPNSNGASPPNNPSDLTITKLLAGYSTKLH